MQDESSRFRYLKVNIEKLLTYGFRLTDKQEYQYCMPILAGDFMIRVVVSATGYVATEIMDTSVNEVYTLHLYSSVVGKYIGEIRTAYQNLLENIAEQCFERNVFKTDYAQRIIQYAQEKYQNEPEFLWNKFPENAIFRRKDSAKWYAALLTVNPVKIGLDGQAKIEILDLRMKTETIKSLVDHSRYFPGYHMNKNHWVTICLDGSVAIDEILLRIDESYALAIN